MTSKTQMHITTGHRKILTESPEGLRAYGPNKNKPHREAPLITDPTPTGSTILSRLKKKKKKSLTLPYGPTGVQPCSCNSPNLPAPDTQITNTDGRASCHTCVARWKGKGEVGITCFSSIHVILTRPAT